MEFTGRLNNVRLINFSVDEQEIIHRIPSGFKALIENGKATISMVDVQLDRMSWVGFPWFKFAYRHVAFRLLLDDSIWTKESPKGIFFLESFIEHPIFRFLGNLVANFKMSKAEVKEASNTISIYQEDKFLHYSLIPEKDIDNNNELYQKIRRIDRSYALNNNDIQQTEIVREAWPIEPIVCNQFTTNFFQSAELIGAFQVKDPLDYRWLDPVKIST